MRRIMLTSLWFPIGQVLFGLWLFERLPLKPPEWLTEGPAFDPLIADPGMARALFFVLLIVVSFGPFIWIDTCRLRRRLWLSDLLSIAQLVFSSKRGALTLVVLIGAFGQTMWFLLIEGASFGSYFVRIEFTIVCGVLMIIVLPPVVIVLANTSDASGQLLESVARQCVPFRVVSLLDGNHLGPTMFANKNDNLRTLRGHSWRTAVHRLVEITPLVIVDARSATPPVCEEISYMLHPTRIDKAVFIINDDGSAPGLRATAIPPQGVLLMCVFAHTVPLVIDGFKKTGRIMPPPPTREHEWRRQRCAECGRAITVLVHRKHGPGLVPITRDLMNLINQGTAKGSFYCRRCNRFYCYDCSDIEKKCRCGADSTWGEAVYMNSQ